MSIPDVVIPEAQLPFTAVPFPLYITVHLGPPDEEALNVTVPYLDYIKNVASSELYPTWPEEALKANIYAINSIAMNRIFTEWYRSRGYDFDITNTPQYDQAYVHERGIFDTISNISNEIFDQYITRKGNIEPLYAAFCDGRISQCNGMYQWGSVDLASQGYTAEEILKYYYGNDITLVESTAAGVITGTYPGEPLSQGDSGVSVIRLQNYISRINDTFPLIPRVEITGFFDEGTENAVKVFQEIFNLPVTGVVDYDTWYKIRYIFTAVTRLADLESEGVSYEEFRQLFYNIVLEGGNRPIVSYIQFFLSIVSQKYNIIGPVEIDGFYDPETTKAVREYQNIKGLNPTGIVDQQTLNLLYREAYSILTSTPAEELRLPFLPFLGADLTEGMGPEYPKIVILEIMLNTISAANPEIKPVVVSGEFDSNTTAAVIAFQELFGLPVTGVVDEETWNRLNEVYQLFLVENETGT
ncbi:MAG: peptidoglycan-binding protein [Tissierellia bacterium]|nr:peptidoglycan-binding protein [Tissierellia bacterium]